VNQAVFDAALRHGCTRRQAELLAVLVVSSKVRDAAVTLGMSESTAKNHLSAIRRRFDAPNTLAVVAKMLS
jgi:DNA-binding CsgD family transcriptional regulator